MSKKISFLTPDKIKLIGILEKSKEKNNKIVILCHGITVDKNEDGIFAELSNNLVKNGFDCLRFDFRGHGESSGKQEEMTIAGELVDLATIFNWLKNQGYKDISLLGASFGGGIVSLFASCRPEIKKLVLWNPALDYSGFFEPKTFWEKKYFGEKIYKQILKQGYVEVGSKKFRLGIKLFHEARFIKPYKELKKYRGLILFVHGDKDSYVSYKDNVKYVKLVGAKLTTIKGAEHGFQDKKEWREEAINKTIEFLKN